MKSPLEFVTSLPFFSAVSAGVMKAMPKVQNWLSPGTKKKGAPWMTNPGLVTCFGWEGDKDAPIAFIDGSYKLRDRGNYTVTFGTGRPDGKINWFFREGYLPCPVSEFTWNGIELRIESFADAVHIGGELYELAYSRVTATNSTTQARELPRACSRLTRLSSDERKLLPPGETSVCDYCICADRFGKKLPLPTAEEMVLQGGFDEHYNHMKTYWLARLSCLASLTLPDKELENAYKAGYILCMIVKDGYELHVGENGYDRVFDHDSIGILVWLLTMGDFRYFREYAANILKNLQYPDGKWKYAWVYAVYLLKTGDTATVREHFTTLRQYAHVVEADRETDGILRATNAIDSNGHWLVDNWSVLTGLASYAFLCTQLNEAAEKAWALAQYDSLLQACEKRLGSLQEQYGISYLPISLDEPNENGARSDPRDANWASMFLFGRWGWDAYLLGAKQEGKMLDWIDKTYEHGWQCRRDISDSDYNFGGYPHGYFCSAYNAGYGSAALRGDKHRETAIEAYLYMLRNAQSGPFSWWEGIGYPAEDSPLSTPHAATGGGSCPHMWGQATASKALLDALLSERFDGTLIICRGIPERWIESDTSFGINNFPLSGNTRGGFCIQTAGKRITITPEGEALNRTLCFSLSCFIHKDLHVTAGSFDSEHGCVTVPPHTETLTITIEPKDN